MERGPVPAWGVILLQPAGWHQVESDEVLIKEDEQSLVVGTCLWPWWNQLEPWAYRPACQAWGPGSDFQQRLWTFRFSPLWVQLEVMTHPTLRTYLPCCWGIMITLWSKLLSSGLYGQLFLFACFFFFLFSSYILNKCKPHYGLW